MIVDSYRKSKPTVGGTIPRNGILKLNKKGIVEHEPRSKP